MGIQRCCPRSRDSTERKSNSLSVLYFVQKYRVTGRRGEEPRISAEMCDRDDLTMVQRLAIVSAVVSCV